MDAPKPNNGDEGMTQATALIFVINAIALILVVTFFLYHIQRKDAEFKLLMQNKDAERQGAIHNQETDAAYKFSWVKNQLNQMQNKCSEKLQKLEGWRKWGERQNAIPPLDLSIAGDCSISEQMPGKGK